ncbi:MAG: haloacid dehalogenase [Rhodobacteraceae bacterium CG17_big_fil_post_rev_8_21_14_2_50_65_11]|nr:MAG: haloacid dehalogenase [Rhodobacteraceae bacterium CG17_big_fil_post_rev_8_21_14_2_50_65_11]
MRTVIFDLDGTLADTSADLIAAANAALVAMGHAPQLVAGRDDSTAFRGGRAMLTLGLERLGHREPEAEVARGYPILLDAYGRALDVHTRLYPGAVAAVEALLSDGVRVGICTNKPEGLAETLLQKLGVRGLFASLIGADTLPTRKPDPAPYIVAVERAGGDVARSLLVGDTITDRETARAAGVASVLVTFGPLGQGVADLGPEALLHHFDDLPALARRLLD